MKITGSEIRDLKYMPGGSPGPHSGMRNAASKKNRKKLRSGCSVLLSCLLCLTLILSMMPFFALAEENGAPAEETENTVQAAEGDSSEGAEEGNLTDGDENDASSQDNGENFLQEEGVDSEQLPENMNPDPVSGGGEEEPATDGNDGAGEVQEGEGSPENGDSGTPLETEETDAASASGENSESSGSEPTEPGETGGEGGDTETPEAGETGEESESTETTEPASEEGLGEESQNTDIQESGEAENANGESPEEQPADGEEKNSGEETEDTSGFATELVLDFTSVTMDALDVFQLTAVVYPETCDQTVFWVSSDTAVASVDENGLVTAMGRGTAVITAAAAAKAEDGSDVFSECAVSVRSDGIIAENADQLASEHPYGEGENRFWEYSLENAENLSLSFAQETELGTGDFILLQFGDNEQLSYSAENISDLAGQTLAIPGSSVRIWLISDNDGNTGWGFEVTEAAEAGAEEELQQAQSFSDPLAPLDTPRLPAASVTETDTAEDGAAASDATVSSPVLNAVGEPPKASVTLNQTQLELESLDEAVLTATVTAENAADLSALTIQWESTDESTVQIVDFAESSRDESSGTIVGTCTIRALQRTADVPATISATALNASDDTPATDPATSLDAAASCTVVVTNDAVLVTDWTQLESDHPYYRPVNRFWQYTDPSARSLTITFDPQSATVLPTDTIIITDGSKNRVGIYTGSLLAGQTVTVYDKTVRIYLQSSESGTGNYGFKVTSLYASAGTLSYTVTYFANGGTNPPESQEKKPDTPLILTEDEPTRSHYTFKGWSTERLSGRVSWYPGDEYNENENLTLYAVWERVATFNDSNRGSASTPYYGPTGTTTETKSYPRTPIELERPETNYDKNVLHIRTVEDLIEFSENCSLDTWSDRLPVVLDNDLSLSDVDFQPIPLFNGSFDGRGHSIFDLSLTDALAPCGLFLETGKDAIIKNLSVTGTVMPRGDNNMTGGIVGLNRGCVMNCSFTGTVAGNLETGGVVGRNEVTGLVTDCRSYAGITGLSQTGGVCGMNYGTLLACENDSYVNTESVDPGLHLEDIDTSSLLNFVHSLTTETAGITTDTGGICGYSEGFIEACVSTAPVGYSRLGYNVGGIAGRSKGYIANSRNEGSVYGRRDVGGIVGQAEPYVEISQPQNLTAALSYRMHALHQSINDAIHDAEVLSDDISGQLSGLSGQLLPVEEAFRELSITDPESVLNMRKVIIETVSGMAGQLQSMSESVGEGSDVLSEDMEAIGNNLDALSGSALQTVDLLSSSENEDIIVDESASGAAEAITLGKTTDCRNSGEINGESNVGGIVGIMALENSLDPEMDLTATDSVLRNRYSYRSVVSRSVNNGPVSAWYECAGGIVGKADIGYITNCAAYSTVALEDGTYAGGIAGLSYGTIQNCVARCSLSGTKYVGGILGNGYASSGSDDRPSSVSDCYSLVEIKDRPQFSGAVSGGAEGDYLANYFVPAGFAGLNKISIQGKAEPILFSVFNSVLSLPEESKVFTLRFVVEGEVVKELNFEYGTSFTRAVFPEVETREGAYAVWDRTDLRDLRFDTTVTATYRRSETALGTELLRDNGRPVAYVIGQFQEGDSLTSEIVPNEEGEIAAFRKGWLQTAHEQFYSIFSEPDYSICVSVAEKLRLGIPEDGLDTHTVHYMAPDGKTEDYRLYLKTEDGYERLPEELFGSYYSAEVPGSEAELCLVRTVQSWWFLAYLAGALLALLILIQVIVRIVRKLQTRPKKPKKEKAGEVLRSRMQKNRKKYTIAFAAVVLVLVLAAVLLQTGWLQSGFEGYRILRNMLTTEGDIFCEISIRTDEGDIGISTTAQQISQDGKMIVCADQYGIDLYICNGKLYLENGRAFRLVNEGIDQKNLLRLALNAVRKGNVVKETDGDVTRFRTDITNDTAEQVLALYLSEDFDVIFQMNRLEGEMDVQDGALTEIRFVGEGETETGKQFDFEISMQPGPLSERPTVPQAVLDSIRSGEGEALLLTKDAIQLFAAWIKNDRADTVDAQIDLRADCGIVSLDENYSYYRQEVDGTDIHCVSSRLFEIYFSGETACTSRGKVLSTAETRLLDAARLIPTVREFFLKGSYSCEDLGNGKLYSVRVSSEEIPGLVESVMPDLRDLNISYEDCVLSVTVRDGNLYSLELSCGGTVRVVTRDVDADASVIVHFEKPGQHTVPKAVLETLVPAD